MERSGTAGLIPGSLPVPGDPILVLGVLFRFRGSYSGSGCSPFRFWGSLLVPGVFEWLPLAQCINGKVLVRDPPPPLIACAPQIR